ncbi:MAG TPA: aspartate-semialdehyde dehydrogenase, partial [Aestuariivirgaceae bacterium]|nr:aspartate-semialdehyde dehydrogenase [Aestuariivirgaceae bacterium]
MGFKVAVVGATGNVGREILTTLAERQFPADEVVALASSASVGREVSFGEDDVLRVQALDSFDFRGTDIVLSSPGSKVSAAFAPRAAKAGAVVIDNTSCFRMEPDVPLIVPEVNSEAIAGYQKRGIIANPNCSTIQMVVALKPLQDQFGIELVNVSTYQSVSGTGQKGISELASQLEARFKFQEVTPKVYAQEIAFNLL